MRENEVVLKFMLTMLVKGLTVSVKDTCIVLCWSVWAAMQCDLFFIQPVAFQKVN